MANKTVFEIEGRFDVSKILSSLKQIRQEMQSQGVKTTAFKGVDKELETATKLLNDFKTQMSEGVSNEKQLKSLDKLFENLNKSISKVSTGLETISKDSNSFNVNGSSISKLTKQVNDLIAKRDQLKTEINTKAATNISSSTALNGSERNSILKEIDDYDKLSQAIQNVGKEKENRYRKTMQNYVSNNSNAISAIDNITTDVGSASGNAAIKEAFKQSITTGDTLEATFKRILQIAQQCNITIGDVEQFSNTIATDYNSIISAARETSTPAAKGQITKNITNNQMLGYTDTNGNFNLNQAGQSLLPSIQSYNQLNQAQQQLTQSEQELIHLRNTAEAQNVAAAQQSINSINEQRNQQQQLTQDYNSTSEEIRENISAQENLNKSFDNLKDVVKNVLSISSAYSGLKRVFGETYEDIKKLDSAFSSIAMVTNKSLEELWSSYSDYAQIANELGQSTENAIKSSALFYQQGLDTKEALSLTEDTMKLATLSGQGFEEATKQMTAALRGFHMEMEEGSHVTDVYSELAANAAADVHGIAYAMSKTASIASSAGMGFETTAAFLTNMIETTQEAPENIGTAMKTIIARFTELKNNVSKTNSEFDDLDYNKVDKALKSVGINIKDSVGQFRNLDDVFLELSKKWDSLDRNTQRYIATTAAGSRLNVNRLHLAA